jgi:hypothetical protein
MPHETSKEENMHGLEGITVLTAVLIKDYPNIQTPYCFIM